MEAIQGAIGLSPSNVVPRGLGTAELESFSGYAARISAKIAVPPSFSSAGRSKMRLADPS